MKVYLATLAAIVFLFLSLSIVLLQTAKVIHAKDLKMLLMKSSLLCININLSFILASVVMDLEFFLGTPGRRTCTLDVSPLHTEQQQFFFALTQISTSCKFRVNLYKIYNSNPSNCTSDYNCDSVRDCNYTSKDNTKGSIVISIKRCLHYL